MKEHRSERELTPAAEDYLAAICTLAEECDPPRPVRICELAGRLGVSPSSASRMAQSMAVWGLVDFRRYGYITLTEQGRERGAYLLGRHRTAEAFLRRLTGKDCQQEAARMEHCLSPETVVAMERFLRDQKVGHTGDTCRIYMERNDREQNETIRKEME